MFSDKEQELIREIIRQRAYYLRGEQRKIERMRINLQRQRHPDFMEKEYGEFAMELIDLHIIFTKLCQL
jgi:hypothetical protein